MQKTLEYKRKHILSAWRHKPQQKQVHETIQILEQGSDTFFCDYFYLHLI